MLVGEFNIDVLTDQKVPRLRVHMNRVHGLESPVTREQLSSLGHYLIREAEKMEKETEVKK